MLGSPPVWQFLPPLGDKLPTINGRVPLGWRPIKAHKKNPPALGNSISSSFFAGPFHLLWLGHLAPQIDPKRSWLSRLILRGIQGGVGKVRQPIRNPRNLRGSPIWL